MDLAWIVLKFGGTSVAQPDAWDTMARVCAQYRADGYRPLVVCSALSGVSNDLDQFAPSESLEAKYPALIEAVRQKHLNFAKALQIESQIDLTADFAELEKWVHGIALTQEMSPLLKAKVMSFGELLLTKMGAAYLNHVKTDTTWFDARDYLTTTDNAFLSDAQNKLSAVCTYTADSDLQTKLAALDGDVLLTQGFIARDAAGETVLLGRGGSDTSAAYFAAKLQAARCEIWTDVPGIYTTNPHSVPAARLLKHLSFEEAREIAAAGAKVLHPRCLDPLAHHRIPLSVHCTPHPDWEGTQVSDDVPLIEAQVKAVSVKTGITIVSMETVSMWQQVGFLSDAFDCFKQLGLSVDLVATSENNVTVSLDTDPAFLTPTLFNELIERLSPYCQATVIKPCASISLIGRHIRSILHQLTSVFEVFKEQQVYLLTQATNDLNLTVVVDETKADVLLHKIHALLFEEPVSGDQFGVSWQNAFPSQIPADYWWYRHAETLLALAETHTPCYVYNKALVQHRAEGLKRLSHVSRIFYAMKANNHPDILRTIVAAGCGIECVSLGEIKHVLDAVPGLKPSSILFTPNFASHAEYAAAITLGVQINLDNMHPLQAWPELFAGKDILLRIDPGLGRGHHKYVQTGGSHSKFGIAVSQLPQCQALLAEHHITVIGLHVHFGSGVMDAGSWRENADFLLDIAAQFPSVRIINLGGGLGVPEKFGQSSLDLNQLNDSLGAVKAAHPTMEIWIEPGRYLVAEAGVLLTRVTQLKDKGDVQYVGVDAGMHNLIRPALYSAYHEIVNLTHIDAPRSMIAHIVGPICETGDTLGYSRVIADTHEGDILLIHNAGAYGAVMSSHYNLRDTAPEYVEELV